MAQLYIITKAQITEFEDVSINVEEKRLQVFIKKAQDLDLRPFMTDRFYYDFIKSFNDDGTLKDNAKQAYKDLYNGVAYEDRQGYEIQFSGIVPALVYWTFARYIEADAVRYTATGPVIKNHDEARGITPGEAQKLVQAQRSTANAHVNDAIKFLEIKKDDYPLYWYNRRNTESRQPGPRIRGVDRTDVTGRYGGRPRDGYYGDGFLSGLI